MPEHLLLILSVEGHGSCLRRRGKRSLERATRHSESIHIDSFLFEWPWKETLVYPFSKFWQTEIQVGKG